MPVAMKISSTSVPPKAEGTMPLLVAAGHKIKNIIAKKYFLQWAANLRKS